MPGINVAEFKRALSAAAKARRDRPDLRARPSRLPRSTADRRAVEQLVGPVLSRAGLDVAKLNETLAERQTAMRRLFQEQKAEAARSLAEQRSASQSAIDMVRARFDRPADAGAADGLSSLVSLSEPFLIWEWPHASAEQLRDYRIQPWSSWAKVLIDLPIYSFDDDSGSDSRDFSFYFLWANDSPYEAIVNVYSVLSLTGSCEVAANAGIFSGDTSTVTVDAWLYPIRYWLPLQSGRTIRDLRQWGDPLQHQQVLNLSTSGGSLFGDAGYASQTFSAASYGLSYQTYGGMIIPGQATAVFEVTLTIGYSWEGNTLPDEIIADFSDDTHNYSVECPIVVLQFLTQPPMMARAGSGTAMAEGRKTLKSGRSGTTAKNRKQAPQKKSSSKGSKDRKR